MYEQIRNRNIYKLFGFTAKEANNLVIRARLMRSLVTYINDNRLKSSQAGHLLDLPINRINDLMNGKISLFSIDTLVSLLGKIGFKITIHCDKILTYKKISNIGKHSNHK